MMLPDDTPVASVCACLGRQRVRWGHRFQLGHRPSREHVHVRCRELPLRDGPPKEQSAQVQTPR
eukprot:51001-Eustigmatos_ZCMA.PRE.1